VRHVHSGREYVSVRDHYSKIVGGPGLSQIAKSLGLSGGPLGTCEFIAEPKSRKGSAQVISGMVFLFKLQNYFFTCLDSILLSSSWCLAIFKLM
jgi:hypothetical protein